jgi:carboxyl-terminal processing protease
MRKILHLFFAFLLLVPGKSIAQKDPVSIFNEIWHSYDTLYSGFAHKDIDWNILYNIYRPRVNEKTSETELFKIATNMLRHLNDNHVQIAKENPERHFSAGLLGYLIDDIGFDSTLNIFMSQPVSEKYFKSGLNILNKFKYGWLQDSIGYFHFGEFKDSEATKDAMDKITQYFSTSKAVIIDVRRNMGGDDRIGKAIADYFADEKREYMITSAKNGPGHNDFGSQKVWYIEPNKLFNYSKPVVLLIDNTSFSAAENFSLAMREIPNVRLVGMNTAGGFADSDWKTLPCGWNVCIPYSLFTDKNGFCWEGIGVPPDYYVKTDPKKPINDKDDLLDFAINLIDIK